MGDPIVSSVINQVMERSTSLATQDFAVLWGLKSHLRSLRTIFTQIQSVLADAEIKQRKNKDLQNWLRKLRAASFQVENVLEEVSTEALLRRLHVERGIKNNVSTFFSASNPLQFRIQMVQKVKEIRQVLDSVAAERINFELIEGVSEFETVADVEFGEIRSIRANGSIESEIESVESILGRDEVKEMIVDKICNDLVYLDNVSDDFVRVYAVWGVGGLGKTTLARMVYKDLRVEKLYDLKIWLCVSDEFSIVRLVRDVLKSIDDDSCDLTDMELGALQRRLRDRLKRRRFLMVLDDVGNLNKGEWDEFMESLRCGCRGSAVLVNTRSVNVANMIATDPTLVYPLGCLSDNDSWLLFKRYAFVEKEFDSVEFETIGKAIVKKCEGLPLALKVLGSSMCVKSSVSEWLTVVKSEVWELTDEGSFGFILPSLKLSYDNLPSHMRQCFALCSIFPKGHEMDKQLLVELWVAYGFVPSKGEADLYDLGEEIFDSLVWRSFLQDVKECIFEGVTTCKMHDEIHALAQSVMKYECSSIMSGEMLKFPEEVLHLSSNNILSLSNEVMAKAKSLRSLVTLGGVSITPTPDYIFEQRYLRVLHLGACSGTLTDLPESVGNLKFLRYLNISRSKIVVLPKSIVQLQNLQTLKLTFCENLCELPEGIRYMRNLRHLNIHGCCSLDHMPLGMGQLRHLRRLSTFHVGQGEGHRINELQELNLLGGELSIKGLTNVKHSSQAVSANLKKKPNINCLNLSWSCKNDSNDNVPANNSEEILEALEPHLNLKTLTISDYQGLHSPNWVASLVNLVSIAFDGCKRIENLPFIAKLPFLKVLELKGMHALKHVDDDNECGNEDLFPCLEKLVIGDCANLIELPYIPNLKSLRIIGSNEKIFRSFGKLMTVTFFEIGGFKEMTCLPDDVVSGLTALEELQIWGCPNLSCLPDGVQNLGKLKSLIIRDCELVKARCEKDVGEDWSKIAHIFHIKINNQVIQ
ncbi:disease resistance protein RGA2-like [Rutidosis leptorrhynchoides]|uniref:disease resistance protein RGA2-like n=1 Tax=Rutidosis leptorrhynchoides TaxID=125765 RepID=UPI003A99B8CB